MDIARACHTDYTSCMTMLSFRVNDSEAHDVQNWAKKLGVEDLLQECRELLEKNYVDGYDS